MAFRSTINASASTSAGIDPGKPAGTAADDILIAEVSGGLDTASLPVVPPAGWTEIATISKPENGVHSAFFWALGNVASTLFDSTLNGTYTYTVRISAFSGRNTTTPITASATFSDSTGFATAPAPSVVAAANDDLMAVWFDGQTNVVFGAPPSPLVDRDDSTIGITRTTMASTDAVAAGATGTLSRTTSNGYAARLMTTIAIAVAGGGGPTVSTVSSNAANEGTSIVHTVTLASAVTGSPAVYSIALAGVTATGGGVDFTSALTNSEFSDGVTISGGNITVPVAVSSFTVTVPTIDDQTIEPAETYTLTVGGTSGTGTINASDAEYGVMATQITRHGKGRHASYGLQRGYT